MIFVSRPSRGNPSLIATRRWDLVLWDWSISDFPSQYVIALLRTTVGVKLGNLVWNGRHSWLWTRDGFLWLIMAIWVGNLLMTWYLILSICGGDFHSSWLIRLSVREESSAQCNDLLHEQSNATVSQMKIIIKILVNCDLMDVKIEAVLLSFSSIKTQHTNTIRFMY